jgi:hypothetical protein
MSHLRATASRLISLEGFFPPSYYARTLSCRLYHIEPNPAEMAFYGLKTLGISTKYALSANDLKGVGKVAPEPSQVPDFARFSKPRCIRTLGIATLPKIYLSPLPLFFLSSINDFLTSLGRAEAIQTARHPGPMPAVRAQARKENILPASSATTTSARN